MNASASATTAASRNTHTRMNSTAISGGSQPAAVGRAGPQHPRTRAAGEATAEAAAAAVVAEDGRAREHTGGRDQAQLRTWEGYGEDFFYYLSGVE